jgi:hypothetical protein
MRKLRPCLCLLVVLGLLTGMAGCTRKFFRNAADEEVEGILAEKDTNPLWKIEQFHVYPDPRARFADPSNPDHPPTPPDDEAAFVLSPHPQAPEHAGVGTVQGTAWLEMIKNWDEMNRAERKAEDAREAGDSGAGTPPGDGPATLPPPKEEKPAKKAAVSPLPVGPLGVDAAALDDQWKPHTGPSAADSPKPEVQLASATVVQEKKSSDGPPPLDAPFVYIPEADPRHPVSTYFDEFLRTQPPGYVLKLDQAVELGVLNSPLYQTFREGLYEAALPVTQQRFNFAYQWAATEDWLREWAGPKSDVGHRNNWTGASTLSFSKLFSTGALLTFDFVNTNTFNFLAPKNFTSVSTVNLNFTQPLLAGGGRAVTLEPLTQAERNLFYAIRAYARFREQFYVNIAIGTTPPGSLAQAAGSAGGGNPISVLAALGIASTDVAGGFVSYLSTLFRECDMAADMKLVKDLERALRIYQGYQEGGQFSPLQVDQVQSTLLQAQNAVLTDKQFVANAVDQFKLSLGLPANLPLILDDAPARPITRQFDKYYEVITDSDAAYKRIAAQEDLPPEKLRAFLLDLYTKDPLVRGTEFQKRLPASWMAWKKATPDELKSRLEKLRDSRRDLLNRKTDLELKGKSLSEAEAKQLRDDEIEADIAALEQVLRQYEARKELSRADRLKLFRLVAYSAEIVLVWARNERFDLVGKQWPQQAKALLGDLDLSTTEVQKAEEVAVAFALSRRWDLMNARAQLVDSWRQLRVTANALMGVFNVQYNLNSSTPQNGSRPFAFSTDRTSETLALDTQLPLNRMAQRNAYRVALINYQQARRALMVAEDTIAVQVRFDVRQLQLFAANYRIQKRVIQSLYAQVESALEVITAPADPSALQATGTTGQANAAALTNQYLTALNSLNGAQTRMYDIWLSYIATRMQLYLDLESLRMDERGVWMEGPISLTDSIGPSCNSCPMAPPAAGTAAEEKPATVSPGPKPPDPTSPGS